MIVGLRPSFLPANSLLLCCSSHEQRCLGTVDSTQDWSPRRALLFSYDDGDPQASAHHSAILRHLLDRAPVDQIGLSSIVDSSDRRSSALSRCLIEHGDNPVVVDVSVLSKKHLLVLMRWLDDYDKWGQLWIVYNEPTEYEIDANIPLSFGISSVSHLPGFSPSSNHSRPLHVAMFLGYEGDRAFATYDILQPAKTTIIIPDPPFRPAWNGRTEKHNENLISALGEHSAMESAHSLDPASSVDVLQRVFGGVHERSGASRALCLMGTNPQAVGAYLYLRECSDPPAVIYSEVLRHSRYYSRGIGNRWIIHRPQ